MMFDFFFQPSTKPEMKRAPACTRIRLKIFPFFLRSREAAAMFPSCVQVYIIKTHQIQSDRLKRNLLLLKRTI